MELLLGILQGIINLAALSEVPCYSSDRYNRVKSIVACRKRTSGIKNLSHFEVIVDKRSKRYPANHKRTMVRKPKCR